MLLGESAFLGGEDGAVLHSYRGKWLQNGSLVDGNLFSSLPIRLNNGYWLWQWDITNANYDGNGESTIHSFVFAQPGEMVPDFSAPCTSHRTGRVFPGTGGKYMVNWGEAIAAIGHSRWSVMSFDGSAFSVVAPTPIGIDGGEVVLGRVNGGDPWNGGNILFQEIGQNGPDYGLTAINPDTGGVVERWGIRWPVSAAFKSIDGQKWAAWQREAQFFQYNQDFKGGIGCYFDYQFWTNQSQAAGSTSWMVYAGATTRNGNNNYYSMFVIFPRDNYATAYTAVINWGGCTFSRIRSVVADQNNPDLFYFVANGDLGVNYELSYHAMLIGCFNAATKQVVWSRMITSNGSNPQFAVQTLKVSAGQFCLSFRDFISTGNRYYSRLLYGPADASFPVASVPSKINVTNPVVTVVSGSAMSNPLTISTIGANYRPWESFSFGTSTPDLTKLGYLGQDIVGG
ncbi:hypothetical protein EI613_18760 [Azospirillum sp. 412522]|nr:hypothetical protein [Azospirillum sp. 412522]MBY6263944.1 hypothetical protein [Azospirillum sp. 412522]